MERRQEKKFTVVDTSAMIGRPDVINLIDGQVFVPLTVIKQLDGLKNSEAAEKRKNARRASNFIEAGIKEKKISVLTKFDPVDGLDNASDNKIVGAAVRLKKENPDAEVSLIATDRNMRIVASAHGIKPKMIKLYCPAELQKEYSVEMKKAWKLYCKKHKTCFKYKPSLSCYAMIVWGVLVFLVSLYLPVKGAMVFCFIAGIVLFVVGLFRIGWTGMANGYYYEKGMKRSEYLDIVKTINNKYLIVAVVDCDNQVNGKGYREDLIDDLYPGGDLWALGLSEHMGWDL